MFNVSNNQTSRLFRTAMCGLVLLSLSSIIVTSWILVDLQYEQEVFGRLQKHLPESDNTAASELAGELRLQSRLTIILILNIVATTFAVLIFVRVYLGTKRTLREVKVLATDILASMDVGVITTDRLGSILSMNPFGEKFLSICDISIGTSIEKLCEDHSTLKEICKHVLKNHDCVRDKDYEITYKGHSKTFRAGCSLLRNESKIELGTVIHFRDVTEKVLMDKRLNRMERYMGLGSLATGLQHEIKNPLSALLLHVQLLKENLMSQNPNSEQLDTLQILTDEINRITNVLERFRNYASNSELHIEKVDIIQLIEKLVRLVTPQASQSHIQIETDIPEKTPKELLLDKVSFEQVLLNLTINAIEAMPEGGILTFQVKLAGNIIYIRVADTGPGIPGNLSERIFDPYYTTKNTGTGMGLAICQKIVQLHNGNIDFETNSEGSTFTISMNLDKD